MSLHLITGPMFSGKTEELVKRIKEKTAAGARVTVVLYDKDIRYGTSAITSHAGSMVLQSETVAVLSTPRLGDVEIRTSDVFVDEGQFFDDLAVVGAWANKGLNVTVTALDSDFLRRPFKSVASFRIPWNSIVLLAGTCNVCKVRPSVYSMRTVKNDALILIGGADMYQAVCAECYH